MTYDNDYKWRLIAMYALLIILLISSIQTKSLPNWKHLKIEFPKIEFPVCEIKVKQHKKYKIIYCDTKSLFFRFYISSSLKTEITSLPPIIPVDPQMCPTLKIEIRNKIGIILVSIANSQIYKILNFKTESDLIKIITDGILEDKKIISVTKIKFVKSSVIGKQYLTVSKEKLQELVIIGSGGKSLIVINAQFPPKEINNMKKLIDEIIQSLTIKIKS